MQYEEMPIDLSSENESEVMSEFDKKMLTLNRDQTTVVESLKEAVEIKNMIGKTAEKSLEGIYKENLVFEIFKALIRLKAGRGV